MSTTSLVKSTTSLAKSNKSNKLVPATTVSATAPQAGAAPVGQPTGSPAGTSAVLAPTTVPQPWELVGKPSTAKGAVAGVGPAPRPGDVGHAALAAIQAAGSVGATGQELQAAIDALGKKGKHPWLTLLRWLSRNRGYSFICKDGVHVTFA